MTRILPFAGVLATFLAAAGPAIGQTFTWNNPSGGNWNVGTNWSGGTVPTAGQNAVIDLSGTFSVSLTDNRSIAAVTVNAAGATLSQTAGDLTASALFTLQAGTLHLSGGRLLGNGGVSTSTGTTIVLDGGQLWATPPSGGSAVINSTVQWSSGEIHGPSLAATPFSINGTVNLIGTGTREIQRTGIVDIAGGTWDAGRLDLGSSSTTLRLPAGQTVVNTAASGKFILATDPDGSVGPVFDIRGTFIKQGTNDTEFWSRPQVNNNGTIDVQEGRLVMMGPGTHTGIFRVATGATLQFRGSQTLNSGQLNVLGAGLLHIGGSTGGNNTLSSNVTLSIASTSSVRLENGSLDLQSNHELTPALLELSGSVAVARLTIRGTTSPHSLSMSGGEIRSEANSNVSVGGTFTWLSGEINWVRTFTVSGAANLPGTGTRQVFGDTFNNRTSSMRLNGGGTWDAGIVKLNGLASITVAAGTTITNTTASGDFSILPPDATASGGSFTLQGTFIKQGTNTTTFGRDINIANSGHLDIRAGTVIAAEEIFTSGGGDYTLASGTAIQAPSIDIRGAGANKAILQGEGTVRAFLDVQQGGRIRAGLTGPGVLTVGTSDFVDNSIFITGHATDPPRIIVAAERTGAGAANAGRIVLTRTRNVMNFNVGSGGALVEFEVLGTGLRQGETYTLIVATSEGGFQRNTSTPLLASGYEFAASDYRLILNSPGVQDVRLFLSDANTLALQFTPTPEPGAILGLAAGALGLCGLIRRVRISRRRA